MLQKHYEDKLMLSGKMGTYFYTSTFDTSELKVLSSFNCNVGSTLVFQMGSELAIWWLSRPAGPLK